MLAGRSGEISYSSDGEEKRLGRISEHRGFFFSIRHCYSAKVRLIFLVVLPPAGCGDCGSGCAEGRSDAGPGGGCEDAAGLGGDCCCDSSEHGENVFVCRGMIRAVAVD